MHKKGIIACSVFSVLVLGALYSSASFAAQTCTTDEQTGQVTCTNSATASVTVAAACSFSRTSDSSGEYTGILANNASVEVTGSTFSTTCNDSGGYAIYAIGYGNNTFGNTDLIFDNDPDNANKITTSSNPGSNTSYWQMKLAAGAENQPVLENGYDSYSAVPSTYTKVASYASADMGTAQTVTATYKAAASSTQPAGTYTGAVKYTMVHPNTNIPNQPYDCAAGYICYFPNAGNTVADTMSDQQIALSDTSATLWVNNFKRPGYGFAGWNTEYDGSGTFYGPNEDIEFEAEQYSGVNGGLSLYAVWVEPAKDSNGNELTFQTNNLLTTTLVDGTTLGNKNNGFVTALRDKRDGQVYAVAKLADGNYWMIENLRLSDSATTLNEGNTNNPASGFTALSVSSNSWCSLNNSSCIDQSKLNTVNTNNLTGSVSSPDTNIYAYGNYYNWYSATAGNGIYEVSSGNTAGDICPAGWSLPTGGNGGQFAALNTAVNSGSTSDSTGLRAYPANFVYSGYFFNSSVRNRGSFGFYWSSTANRSDSVYSLSFSNISVNPGAGSGSKYYGYSVRCVLGS